MPIMCQISELNLTRPSLEYIFDNTIKVHIQKASTTIDRPPIQRTLSGKKIRKKGSIEQQNQNWAEVISSGFLRKADGQNNVTVSSLWYSFLCLT